MHEISNYRTLACESLGAGGWMSSRASMLRRLEPLGPQKVGTYDLDIP